MFEQDVEVVLENTILFLLKFYFVNKNMISIVQWLSSVTPFSYNLASQCTPRDQRVLDCLDRNQQQMLPCGVVKSSCSGRYDLLRHPWEKIRNWHHHTSEASVMGTGYHTTKHGVTPLTPLPSILWVPLDCLQWGGLVRGTGS
jgi:hypothetical protein